jgi:hypothetical protein
MGVKAAPPLRLKSESAANDVICFLIFVVLFAVCCVKLKLVSMLRDLK